jgi:hypothetical protein
MLQMTFHLTRSSRLLIFQLLEFEVFQVRFYRGAIFNRLRIKNLFIYLFNQDKNI